MCILHRRNKYDKAQGETVLVLIPKRKIYSSEPSLLLDIWLRSKLGKADWLATHTLPISAWFVRLCAEVAIDWASPTFFKFPQSLCIVTTQDTGGNGTPLLTHHVLPSRSHILANEPESRASQTTQSAFSSRMENLHFFHQYIAAYRTLSALPIRLRRAWDRGRNAAAPIAIEKP